MPLVLMTRVTSPERRKKIVQDEIRSSLNVFGREVIIPRLHNDVKDWEEKPTFKVEVAVDAGKWEIRAKVNRKNKIGKIYTWVDEGTAVRGGKSSQPYPIVPKKSNKSGRLWFMYPTVPIKTNPNPAIPGYPSSDTPVLRNPPAVMHPGIYPRNFTKTLAEELSKRTTGGFRSIIEAAVKRAFRKIRKSKG